MEIQILENRTILDRQFYIYGTAENPLFLAKDVAEWIEHSNLTEMLRGIDESEKIKIRPKNSLGLLTNNNEYNFLTEDGLYEVLMQSRKPIAKEFKKQVKEILKSIRKHGAYLTPQKIEEVLHNPDLIIGLATKLKEEQEKRIQVEKQLELQAPKVLFTEAVMGSQSSCLVGELAKIITQNGYEIGEKRLFKWLGDNHYLGTKGERYNIPNQQYIEQGLFELKKGTRSGNGGVMHTTITPKVTGKGQVYFINKFLKKVA